MYLVWEVLYQKHFVDTAILMADANTIDEIQNTLSIMVHIFFLQYMLLLNFFNAILPKN